MRARAGAASHSPSLDPCRLLGACLRCTRLSRAFGRPAQVDPAGWPVASARSLSLSDPQLPPLGKVKLPLGSELRITQP